MIRVLPPEVVDQIAAGEVVERPASVVKELVENALDAGARRVLVEIAAGGAELVRVTDDGDGFVPEDLPLAFASHATSKLQRLADLDHIGSFGFRGEALASIGSIARCTITSRRRDRDEAFVVRCDGGRQQPVQPASGPAGTRIEVRDLFFNTPARRRFLKSPGAERARIQETCAELLLLHLEVDATLVADGKEVLRLPAGETLPERFARCFGRELARGLLPVQRDFGVLRVEGIVAEPDLARRDGRLELLYVNGRRAAERSSLHALRQAHREFLMGGRFPVYALHVALPPELVDVNVHPRKAEVRFLESRRVAGSLHDAVRAVLQARVGTAPADERLGERPGGVAIDDALPRARSGFPLLPGFAAAPHAPVAPQPARVVAATQAAATATTAATVRDAGAARLPNPFAGGSRRFLQVHDLYVVLAVDDGILVVDQHALHERVVYERLRAEHRARAVAVQRLLAPAVVELQPGEKAWVLDAREVLQGGGLEVDDFGPGSVAVHAVPAVFHRADPERLLRAVLPLDGAEGRDGGGDARQRLEEQLVERFHSMACRSAVMSGDRLDEAEIAALLDAASGLEHPHNCPHGRPTVLTFTGAELERYFRRRC